ncbi:MAG: type II toxin-antitoxin system RelE/ParE family toxin [Nitrospirota bacterium]
MKIVWSPLAIERVSEIAQYIAQDSPKEAAKWVDIVFKKVKRLKNFPKGGWKVPETKRMDIQEILYDNYKIICKISPNNVSILTVRHGKQILPQEGITE